MPAAPPPSDVNDWPSHAYWRKSDERIKQLWYVSFCLMMSSVQDRLTGLALQEDGNLNWATTAFYYSAVHAGRLLCFVCTGDYPMSHEDLAVLLAPNELPRFEHPRRQFQFRWLDTFLRYVGRTQRSTAVRSTPNSRPERDAIVRAIDTKLPALRAAFDEFAPLLAKFRNLRNDCNYEALLVAHEINHIKVTDGFRDLVASAETASKRAVDLAVAAYSEHIQRDECFQPSRHQFLAAHAKYMSGRFTTSLTEKFSGSRAARTELQRIAECLEFAPRGGGIDLDDFLEPIMYNTFGGKRGLMERWQDDIGALARALTGRTN